MNRTMIFLAICIVFVILISSGYFARSEDTMNLLEVDVQGLIIDPVTNSPVVILVGRKYKKALPIFIGAGEAGAIARGMGDIETIRPMTHDLMKDILDGVEAKVERVIITDLQDNVFFAQSVLQIGKSKKVIDCRPSDAIALAVRMESPIFVAKEVMEESSNADLTGWVVGESMTKHFGFKVQKVSEELMEAMGVDAKDGVLVSYVEEGSPAEKGDLCRGDVILSIQGTRVSDVSDFDELLVSIPENDEIRMVVSSPGGKKEINLTPEMGGE